MFDWNYQNSCQYNDAFGGIVPKVSCGLYWTEFISHGLEVWTDDQINSLDDKP